MSEKSNIFAKLAKARVMLQNTKLKKSGFNGYAKYEYYQLDDFLPTINKINEELGLISCVGFGSPENMQLTIVNIDNPDEQIRFYSKNVEAGIKGAQAIQNLGGEQTYQRRYLYLQAYEITENDSIDAQNPKNNLPSKSKSKPKKELVAQTIHPYKLSSDDMKKLELTLLSLETKEEINEKYAKIQEKAGERTIDQSITELFADVTQQIEEQHLTESIKAQN